MSQKGLMFLEGDGSKCLNQIFSSIGLWGGGGGGESSIFDSLSYFLSFFLLYLQSVFKNSRLTTNIDRLFTK